MTGVAGPLVLVVEDDPIQAFSYTEILQDEGVRVLGPFPTAEEAEAAIDEEIPDFAIIDFDLGAKRTSLPVQRALTGRNIPYVLLTGRLDLLGRGDGGTAIPSLTVPKPLDRQGLMTVLSHFGVTGPMTEGHTA